MTGEVTTLTHEFGDDTVELGTGVAKSIHASAEFPEVPGSLWMWPMVSDNLSYGARAS
jgi:hypothetical protein